MLKVLTIIVALIAIASYGFISYLQQTPELPKIDYDRWWGNGPKVAEDTAVRPFKIEFNDTMIADLKSRLKNRRPLTKPLEGIKSEYGINTIYLEKVLNYWVEKYDFKERANNLNQLPRYKTRIQGLDIHFIRMKPKVQGVKTLPLLMLHGWPSSSKEFQKVIPLLTTPRTGHDFVFEVIAADLPGYGFSEGTNKPGLSALHIGVIMRNLMRRLGYNQFYIQAGDWGSNVATHMVTVFPDEILGFHTNMPMSARPYSYLKLFLGSFVPTFVVDPKHAHRIYPLSNYISYILRESGYFHIQATKPDTIGVGLTDSPAGMAAYVMEKIGVCTNRDQTNTDHGGLAGLELEDVLDTLTIIWNNNCIVTSSRLYAEGFSKETKIIDNIPTKVPTAAVNFRYEVVYHPDWMLRDKFHNLVHSTIHDFGGHFAGLQTPKELADDIFLGMTAILEFHKKET
ncbi:PREDICTED: juvenile hormone epoxide hydrolase-like [Papilio polytes]|uniref:juvenile hormone epoxide hydrolase-like n=1 Tax=Papilio polytes TaxID=76194 RepID=UPI0006761E02|nr:PREDICTED: juvenile hormone epoxide hydrolase-like [Papilio polytes]